MIKRLSSLTALSLLTTPLLAQDGITMADTMRENGKIYVVVGVLTIIFTVLIVYLVLLDRRLARIEKNKQNETP